MAALKSESEDQAQAAMAQLCQTYWYPLYAFVRRKGYSAEDSEDLTQGFFQNLISRESLSTAAKEKGKLRSFLLGSLKNFLAGQYQRENRQKRGGGTQILSIDQELAEHRYQNEPHDDLSPEVLFDRRWAMTILDNVYASLEKEYADRDKQAHFKVLSGYLSWNDHDRPQAEAAAELEMTEPAFRAAVVRIRKRYRKLLREQISDTVVSEKEVEPELTELMQALRAA